MTDKLSYIPTERDTAWAIIEARDTAQSAPQSSSIYAKTSRGSKNIEVIGRQPAGPHMTFESRETGGFAMNGHYTRRDNRLVKQFSTKTEVGDLSATADSQEVKLHKYNLNAEPGQHRRELVTSNPFVVRIAEIAIANAIKKEAGAAKAEHKKAA